MTNTTIYYYIFSPLQTHLSLKNPQSAGFPCLPAAHSSCKINIEGAKSETSLRLIELRKKNNLSQRDFTHKLQLVGYDIDKNVITRIEINKRYVTDIELQAFSKVLDTTYNYLINGK